MNLYQVNFKTDQAVYDKFRLICTMKKEKYQEKLTEFIQKYVKENEEWLANPKVQEQLQPELPSFFDEPIKWAYYIQRSDTNRFKEIVTRVNFLRFLVCDYVIQKENTLQDTEAKVELKKALMKLDTFRESDDYSYFTTYSGGLIPQVQKKYPFLYP